MAKVIQVSPDDGSTWYDLPGSGGSFNMDGEPIDDTILGSTFRSNLAGLITWGVDSDAIYKGYAGYLAKILQQGTATAFTAEAMTLVSGKTYKIDATAKEIWDRATVPTIYDDAVDKSDEVLYIDYLYGQVTFKATYTVTGAVTADGEYFPTTQLGKGNSYTLTMSAETKDTSDFATVQANSGNRTFEPGLRTVALELGGIFDSTVNSKADLVARGELIIEIDPTGTGESICRGFFRMLTTGQSGDVGALEEETLSLSLNVPSDAQINDFFSWRHTATTLPQAVQEIITAWETEVVIDVQYLPSGATGQSPLDGIKGDAMLSDISLSGGLSDMNVFAATFQGSGAITEV